MDTKKRKIAHDYNLRSRTRRIQLRSRNRHQRNRDASSSNNQQESPNQQSSNSTRQQNRSNRSQKRRRRGSTQRPSKSSSSVSNQPNDASDDVECVICLDTVVDQEMKYIPCGHGFHKVCCNNWLSVNDACPVCRTVVATARRAIMYDNRDRIIHDTPISDIIYFFSLSVIRT